MSLCILVCVCVCVCNPLKGACGYKHEMKILGRNLRIQDVLGRKRFVIIILLNTIE